MTDGTMKQRRLRDRNRSGAAMVEYIIIVVIVAIAAIGDRDCSGAQERIARFVAALGDDFRLEYTVKGDGL